MSFIGIGFWNFLSSLEFYIPTFLLDVVGNALHLRRREPGRSRCDNGIPNLFRIENENISGGVPSDLPTWQGQDRLHLDGFGKRTAQFVCERGSASTGLANGFAPDSGGETE